jgi:hypothetical protein
MGFISCRFHSRTQTSLLFPCIPHAFRQNICDKEPCYPFFDIVGVIFTPLFVTKLAQIIEPIPVHKWSKMVYFEKILFFGIDVQRLNPCLFSSYHEEGDFFKKRHFLGGFNTCAYIWQPRVKTPPLPSKSLRFFLAHG